MSHYFTEPDGPERRRTVAMEAWGRPYAMTTANGVFSAGGLDRATAVLLRTFAPPRIAQRVLDLGCGWGALAVPLAVECPAAQVDAVDVNPRARALCALNAAAAGARVRVFAPEDADPQVRYNEIWSNPPIRVGKDALHELLSTWLGRLAPAGVARFVVGKNLGADSLQRWLAAEGYVCERAASAKGFRVFSVRNRPGVPSAG